MDKEFCLYTHSSELCLERYSFDHEDISAMANFFIAQSSIDELGKEICAAKILSDMFFWGITSEERKQKVDELKEKIIGRWIMFLRIHVLNL